MTNRKRSQSLKAKEYRRRIEELGFTQEGAARFFGASPRSGRYWVQKGPPPSVMLCLYLMEWADMTVEDVLKRL
jgi:DNA-binding XRE family transcriptional regulator